MRIPRLYSDCDLQSGARVSLDEAAAHYVGKVLRMREGQALRLFNGRGGQYQAQIEQIGKKQLQLIIGALQPGDSESPLAIELGIAISRGERMDHVVQKATELGVSRICPLLSERGEVKLKGERAEKKLAHWRGIIISACEQCGRNRLPELLPIQPLAQWLPGAVGERKFVLHHRHQRGLDGAAPTSVSLLIGPEGGLSEAEIQAAENSDFQPLRLGPRVLRTETAPLAALSILQYHWGDLG